MAQTGYESLPTGRRAHFPKPKFVRLCTVMEKDFDRWNEEKKTTNAESARFYTVREIWWRRLGVNVGSEQDGNGELFLRPVVIVRSFGAHTCLILPLTTSAQKHPLRIPVGEVQGKSASAIMSQMRVIDTRRLVEKIGFLDKDIFTTLRKKARMLF